MTNTITMMSATLRVERVMGLPVAIEYWEPHPLARRWVIVWERYKILAYKTHDEAVAAARRLGYEITNESPCQHREE